MKPLPGRINIVLSRDGSFEPKRALVCQTLDEALQIGREHAAEDGASEVCVIGGAEIFHAGPAQGRRLYLTPRSTPRWRATWCWRRSTKAEWVEVSREPHPAGEDDEFPFIFRVLERR